VLDGSFMESLRRFKGPQLIELCFYFGWVADMFTSLGEDFKGYFDDRNDDDDD